MPYTPVKVVEVEIWGDTVGAITLDPGSGYYAFEYDPMWVRGGFELSPLRMPLRSGPYVFATLPDKTFLRLPAMLADAVPDKFGNALIDAYMAANGVKADAITPLDRLAYIGRRGMGALEFKPPRGPTADTATTYEIGDLVREARSALTGSFGTASDATASVRHLIEVGTSAGGARAKAVIAWNRDTGEIRGGQMDAPDGFEHWLIKLDGVGVDQQLGTTGNYGRVEYAYHLMARAAGIDMTDCELIAEGGRAHFTTRRFDRVAGEKVHAQTLCGIAHLDFSQIAVHDYSQYLQTVQQLELGADVEQQAFRRIVFNVAAANCDDHTKNFSFLRSRGGQWELAPAYDITHAFSPTGAWTFQHLMSVNGKFTDITRADLIDVADRHQIVDAVNVIKDVNAAIDSWTQHANAAEVPADTQAAIAADLTAFKIR